MTVADKHIHYWSLEGPLPKLCSWCETEIQDDCHCRTKFNIRPYTIEDLVGNDYDSWRWTYPQMTIGRFFTKMVFKVPNGKSKMATTTGQSLTLDPMGKYTGRSSSWKRLSHLNLNISINDHWNVLYQNSVLSANLKSKMAATVGHSITLDPIGNTLEDLLGNDYNSWSWSCP